MQWRATIYREGKIIETTFLTQERRRLPAEANDLIQLIDRKVIAGKYISR
jgi:hypothetical protein